MDRDDLLVSLIARLKRLQDAVSEAEGRPVSDGDFARRYLAFSSTTLSRIRSKDDPYNGNLNRISEQVSQAEEEIEERLSSVRTAVAAERTFVQTTLARATQASVKKARDSRLRRVVVLLAPTGAGKSEVGNMLATKGAVYIEGRQSWRKSYKAVCADIARAAGRPMKLRDYNEHDAEERMLAALKSRDNVLYIDEANTLSSECVNALKLIVNATGTVVVIASIPQMWDNLIDGSYDEVAQLVNRCQPILRHKGLSAEDVRPFLARAALSDSDVDQCLLDVVSAANEFGSLKTVVALADALADVDRPTHLDVVSFLRFHRKNLVDSGLLAKQQQLLAAPKKRGSK